MNHFRPIVSLLPTLVARRRAQMSAPSDVPHVTGLSAAPGWHAVAGAWGDFSAPIQLRRVTSDAFLRDATTSL